jgi:hypothetical protein
MRIPYSTCARALAFENFWHLLASVPVPVEYAFLVLLAHALAARTDARQEGSVVDRRRRAALRRARNSVLYVDTHHLLDPRSKIGKDEAAKRVP